MKKSKVAVVGLGNIGIYAINAILNSPDMELSCIIRRDSKAPLPEELKNIEIKDSISNNDNIDVAILCTPSRNVEETAKKYLEMGINTVDSFDIHSSIVDLRANLNKIAKENDSVSIVSAGWDPGSDSIIRTLMEAMTPKGITYTNFGAGMSMGHSVAVKGIKGVVDALSLTIPLGTGIHRRMVYVQIEETSNFEDIKNLIKKDSYFANDETHVLLCEDINLLKDVGHGVNILRKGVSGKTHNQLLEFNMKINNPALTSQIMISCARASLKQKPGAYTMIEIPIIDFLAGDRETLIKKLV